MSLMRRAVTGLIFLLFAVPAFATDYYADVAGGPWTSSSTWHLISNSGPAAPGGTYPGSAPGDKAIIDFQGITITLNTTVPNPVTLDANNVSCFVVINAGSAVTLTGGSQIAGGTILQLNGGTLDNDGTLDIRMNSGFTWAGGTLTGSGATNIAADPSFPALLTISGGTLDAHTLNLNGKATYTGGWSVNNGAQVNIAATGTFDIQSLGPILTNTPATADINNAGVFKKTAGGGGTNVDVSVNNNNIVQVTTGTLVLGGSPLHTNGDFDIGAGCSIEFHGTFAGTNDVTGLGTASIVGTPVIDNGATVNFTNVAMNGGWIQGPAAGLGTANISGTVTFNGGVWRQNLLVGLQNTSTVNIVGAAAAFISDGARVNNDGVFDINAGAGGLVINNGGYITNNNVIHLVGDVTINSDSVNNARIDNTAAGQIFKTSGAGTAIIKTILNNGGLVESDSGSIQFTKSGVHTNGTFKICDACVFDFAGGNHTLDNTLIQWLNFNGGSVAKLSGATFDVLSSSQISTNNEFIHTAGTITGAGTLTIFASYHWSGGSNTGTGDTSLASYSHLFDGANSAMVLDGRNMAVNGTISYSPIGANLLAINNGATLSLNGATLDLTTDAAIDSDGTGTIDNLNSTVTKSGGAGKAVIHSIFNNTTFILVGDSKGLKPNGLFFGGATLNVNSGQVALNGGGTNTGNIFVPNAANAVIFEASTYTLAAGTFTNPADLGVFRVNGGVLTLTAALTLTNVELLAGSICGSDLNISNKMSWKGGTLLGPGNTTIDATATLTHLAPIAPTFLDNRTLNNNGIVEYEGNGLQLTNDAVINNNASAEFRTRDGGLLNGTGANVFNNLGTLRKNLGTSGMRFDVPVKNTGTVSSEVNGQSLIFANGGTMDPPGSMTTSAGALIDFFFGAFTISGGTVGGTGQYRINGGTLLANTPLTFPSFALSSGKLTGSGDVTVNGGTWSGGDMTGGGATIVNNGATFSVITGAAKILWRPMTNNGTLVFVDGPFTFQSGVTLTNNSVIDFQGDLQIACVCTPTVSQILNASGATFKKTAGTVDFSNAIFPNVNNDGTVLVQSGGLDFLGAGTHTGPFDFGAHLLTFSGGANTFSSTSSLTGTRLLQFSSGPHTFSGTANLTGDATVAVHGPVSFNSATALAFPTLIVTGTLGGSADITIGGGSAVSEWLNGTITGTGSFTVAPGAQLDITGFFGSMTLDGRPIVNNGTISHSSANPLTLANGSTINNNAVFTISANGAINGGSPSAFLNDGTFTKTAGGGVTNIAPAFNNNNTVNLNNGTVAFNGGFTQAGGTTTLAGGNMAGTLVDLNAGVLSGNGTITANVDNGAAINPGTSPGAINILGNYTQSGTLNIEIGGTAPATGYDVLAVSGTATLGGTLNATLINSYVPTGGETFDVVTFASSSGAFATENLPSIPGGAIESNYLPNSYQLMAVTAQADVAVSQTASGPVMHGQDATFTITVQNLGPSTATGIMLSDTLTGGSVVSIDSTVGTCTVTPLQCNIGTLTSGANAVITLVVNANTVGTITNNASVTSSPSAFDPNTANNSTGAANVTVSPAADLKVIKSGPGTALSGGTVTYTIQVTNLGPDTAAGVVVSESTPSALNFQSNTGACTTPFPCSIGNVLSGETKTITSTYTVHPSASGTAIINSASATSTTADPVPSNNGSSVATTVDCPAAPPSNLAPTGKAATTGVLTWTGDGAVVYDVYLGVAGTGCSTLFGTTSATSLAYADLEPGTMYEWRVEARIGSCNPSSACVTFTTEDCEPLGAPLARVVGLTTTGSTYALEYDSVPGATRYEIEEATNASFTGATITSVNAPQLSKSFSHSVPNAAPYFYRVRAFNECGEAGPYSLTVRVVIIPIAPPSNNPNTAVPVGSEDLVVQQVFVPGQPGQTLFFTAATDQPWLTVQPASGLLPPGGITLNAIANPSNLPNGTWTATVIVTITDGSSLRANGTTFVSVPVSVSLVTPITPISSKGATSPHAVIIPAVGHNGGIDSQWQSDVRITNAGFRAYRYKLTFTPTGGVASGVKSTEVRVDAGFTTALDDIVRNWYGFGVLADGTSGMLEIVPVDDVENAAKATVVTSRTYNVQEKGTLGQFIPAIPFANFIGAAASGALPQILSLQQIAQNNVYRTNVGIAEGAGINANAVISVFNAAGAKLKDIPVQLTAGQQVQFNSLLATHNLPLDDGRIEVKVSEGGGKITAFASVVDGGTGDPLLVDGTLLQTSGATKYVLPGAANVNTGFANWQTDMRVFNFGSAPQPATLTFFPLNNGTPKTAQITANPNQVLALDNIVKSLFGLDNAGGAIHIDTASSSSLVVTGRTYNVTSEGTLGQFVTAVTPAQAIGANEGSLYIPQVEDSIRYRTNIGVAETTGKETVIELQVKLPDAKITPVVRLTLAANEFRQMALIRELQLGNVYNALVTVKVLSGGRVTAYGSVIDELTGDPTFVPPQKTR